MTTLLLVLALIPVGALVLLRMWAFKDADAAESPGGQSPFGFLGALLGSLGDLVVGLFQWLFGGFGD